MIYPSSTIYYSNITNYQKMSAYNNNLHPQRDDRLGSGQLNENHGIAATGLNEPFTHATHPTHTQGTTAERNTNTNFSGPPIADERKVDQTSDAPGMYNPSPTNRTAATGVPPVNNASHERDHVPEGVRYGHSEQDSGIHDLSTSRAHSGSNAHHTGSAALGDHGASHHQKHQRENEGSYGQGAMTSGGHVSGATGTGATGAGVPGATSRVEGDNRMNTGHPTTVNDIDHRPSAGEKIKGNLEKLTGKVTGNQTKVVKGDNLAHGRSA